MSRILVYSLLLTCFALATSAHDVQLLVPRYNVTGPGPEEYECVSDRASDYYGIGISPIENHRALLITS